MKHPIKITIWIAAILAALVIIGIAGLTIFFPKEKVRAMAVDKISAALDRKVTIDGISVSFWGGIGAYLEGLKISNPQRFGGPDFVSAKALDVKVAILPLLKKEIQITRLILVEPEINMHKLSDGRSNFKFGAAAPANDNKTSKEEISDETKVAAAAISFDNLRIKDGSIRYLDDSASSEAGVDGFNLQSKMETTPAGAYHANGNFNAQTINYSAPGIKLPPLTIAADYDVTADLKANTLVLSDSKIRINDIELALKAGIPNLQTMAYANAEATIGRFELQNVINLLPETMKAKLAAYNLAGETALKVSVKYNKNSVPSLNYDGHADLTNIKISKKDIKGDLEINSAAADFKTDYLKLIINKGSFDNNPLEGYVTVNSFNRLNIDAKFKGQLNLALLNAFLPKAGEPKIAGDMTFDITAKGSVKDAANMQVTGSIVVKNGSYSATTLPEPVQSFNIDMKLAPGSLSINSLSARFPSSDMNLTGTLTDPFPYLLPKHAADAKKPNLAFTLKSQRFDTDKLFPEAVPGSGVNPTEIPVDSLPAIILPDINGKGKAIIDTLIYSKVEFTRITGDVDIRDRSIFVTNANGNVYTGRVKGETTVDLNDFNNPRYSGKFEATQIEANDFITRFSGFGGHLYGKTNMDGTFSCVGWDPQPIIQSLTMDGLAAFADAKIVNFDLLSQLAQNLNLKMPSEEQLKDFATAFKVKDGRVIFDGMKFLSSFGDWNMSGSVGFDGSIEYSGDVLLSDQITGNLMSQSTMVSGLASLLKDSRTGRVRVPFRLGGSYSNPKISLDLNAKEKAKDNLKGKVDSALQDLLKKK
ncbi:hypothetical protein TRIP_C21487 [Candidatus Zixiibacteriota bacterium]|nr:hypothetical protein TRIP_C21487 [candidate division Zixibacteria bacterium]